MTTWQDFACELDAWGASGRTATFWWRDDDATAPSAALDRLLAARARHDAPLLLAVIPARAQASLAERLAREPRITIAQHGWAHANHAPAGAPKAELGADRPIALQLGELARGRLVIENLFGTTSIAALVPPHNRIAPALAASLALAGYTGLSTYGPRNGAAPGLRQVNTHVDIMNWTTRAFAGEAPSLALAVKHLRARRTGAVDPAEPTGLLTHHLAHDEPAWAFIDGFLAAVGAHPAAGLVDAAALLRAP